MSKTVSSTAQEIVSRAVTSSLSAAKRQIFGAALNKQQVALVSDGEIKSRTTWVLLITAFIDLSGAVLLVGGAPMMCSNAPGSVAPGAPGAFSTRCARPSVGSLAVEVAQRRADGRTVGWRHTE